MYLSRPMDQISSKALSNLLETPKNIVVVGHKNPDGDAIGSCCGLGLALEMLGHKVTIMMPNDYPEFLKWMPMAEKIVIYDKDQDDAKSMIKDAEVIFTLDFNELNRTGNMESAFQEASADFVLIDHHQQPGDYATVTYSDTAMSSTSEMVYHTLDALGHANLINADIATLLYTGIMTDTGSFRFPATSSKTHKVVAALIEAGADNSSIHRKVYDTNTPDRLRLLGTALNNLTILPEFHTAYICLSQQDLDNNNFRKGDTEGFVNYALSIKGINFAVIFIENRQEDIVKISFRSKGSFSVNTFARTYFDGGGHNNAAGGRSQLSLSETISHFISILPSHINELNYAL